MVTITVTMKQEKGGMSIGINRHSEGEVPMMERVVAVTLGDKIEHTVEGLKNTIEKMDKLMNLADVSAPKDVEVAA